MWLLLYLIWLASVNASLVQRVSIASRCSRWIRLSDYEGSGQSLRLCGTLGRSNEVGLDSFSYERMPSETRKEVLCLERYRSATLGPSERLRCFKEASVEVARGEGVVGRVDGRQTHRRGAGSTPDHAQSGTCPRLNTPGVTARTYPFEMNRSSGRLASGMPRSARTCPLLSSRRSVNDAVVTGFE